MKLTDAQQDNLRWLQKQGGSGYLDKFGRLCAGGEQKPQGSWPAWLNLIAHGLIAGVNGRLTITDDGRKCLTANGGGQRRDD